MGRPSKFKPEQLEDIAYELAEKGFSDRKISRHLGIHYNTLLNYKKREAFARFVTMLAFGREDFRQLRIMEAFWRVFKIDRYINKKIMENITKTGLNSDFKPQRLDKKSRMENIRMILQANAMPDMDDVVEQTPDIDLRAIKSYYRLGGLIK